MKKLLLILMTWLMVVGLAQAEKRRLQVEPTRKLETGRAQFLPQPVDDTATRCSLEVDRTNWLDAKATIRIWMDLSMDGGRTWTGLVEGGKISAHWVEATSEGGLKESSKTVMTRSLPPGENRFVRGGYDVGGQAFTSALAVECE